MNLTRIRGWIRIPIFFGCEWFNLLQEIKACFNNKILDKIWCKTNINPFILIFLGFYFHSDFATCAKATTNQPPEEGIEPWLPSRSKQYLYLPNISIPATGTGTSWHWMYYRVRVFCWFSFLSSFESDPILLYLEIDTLTTFQGHTLHSFILLYL